MAAPTRALTPKIAAKIFFLARRGCTDQQIATIIEFSARTIRRWKHDPTLFLEKLNRAKKVADELVERSLFERAIGYDHPEEKIFPDPSATRALRVQVMRHYPPDVVACIFWLKNRRRLLWNDRVDLEHSGALRLDAVQVLDALTKRRAGLPIPPPSPDTTNGLGYAS